jgi:hypothetical protein
MGSVELVARLVPRGLAYTHRKEYARWISDAKARGDAQSPRR